MPANPLLLAMVTHMAWVVWLYIALTIVRAPEVWGSKGPAEKTSSWKDIERRVSANLSNQFEWPLFFYAICLLVLHHDTGDDSVQLYLAWVFVAGRVIHSLVQILTTNIRLRGIVFTINFVAVLAMWARFLATLS